MEKVEGAKELNIGYPEEFVKHGTVSDIEKKYGIDVDSIIRKVCDFLKE